MMKRRGTVGRRENGAAFNISLLLGASHPSAIERKSIMLWIDTVGKIKRVAGGGGAVLVASGVAAAATLGWAAAQLQQKPRGRWCCRVPCRTLDTTNQVCEQGFESPLTFSLQCNWSGGCFQEAVTCCSWFCSGQKEGAGAASLQRHPMRQDFPGKGKSKLFLRHRHQACQVWPAKAKKNCG